MKNLIAITILGLTISCGKNYTVNNSTLTNSVAYEKVKCYSDGSYTECSILNEATKIVSVEARVNEDCLEHTDYYLLNEKTIVTRNGCKALFTLEVK